MPPTAQEKREKKERKEVDKKKTKKKDKKQQSASSASKVKAKKLRLRNLPLIKPINNGVILHIAEKAVDRIIHSQSAIPWWRKLRKARHVPNASLFHIASFISRARPKWSENAAQSSRHKRRWSCIQR